MISARELLGNWPRKAKQFNATRSFSETLNKPMNSTRIIHPELLLVANPVYAFKHLRRTCRKPLRYILCTSACVEMTYTKAVRSTPKKMNFFSTSKSKLEPMIK